MSHPDVGLRRLELDDWPAVHSWSRLPEASRYQAWGPDSEAETKSYVEQAVAAWTPEPPTMRTYAAVVDGEVTGLGTLHVRNQAHRQGEIAYATHPRVWGRGIGTSIGAELLRIGFDDLGLHRIVGTCDPRNVASARILVKLGMSHEGRLRHTMLIRDGWRDSELFSILAPEWWERAAP